MTYKIAVVGATGNVGQEMLNILAERGFPTVEVVALASRRSLGREVSFGDTEIAAKDLAQFDFTGVDIALFAASGEVAREYGPKAAKAGAVVIDNSSAFRMEPDVPLIVPEVNADAIEGYTQRNIIANPNCSTAQMLVALKPLHDKARIKRVVVSTYQSVSGAGRDQMDELFNQTRGIFVNDPIETNHFTKQIAFNVIPHIDEFMAGGDTREEWKMKVETHKILDRRIEVTATCVRVPVFVGHAESINVEFHDPITDDEARDILREAPGCMVVDNPAEDVYITPVECVGDYATFISRIRMDTTVDNGLNMWVVSDNLRKGAALNAVQIAETLINKYLKKEA